MSSEEGVVSVGSRPLSDYVLSIIILLNQGVKKVVLKGKGGNINKAIAVYNAVKDRLGDSVKLEGVEIGSEYYSNRKRVSYIKISLTR
ncbi:MAG: DNA-binding protein [Sulfolobales archaeon]|nr:DNA-binding protein [Sulfolobales archaeon]MCX8186299.1 DNA-binding protein [Sulfolobales archaeon]MDW7968965.1 DNA-binding protein [Sulfolobales archaeon]